MLLPGCVTRRLEIRSEPPGAQVLLDGKLVGETPYEEVFLSYGTRRLELRLPGHERRVELLDVWRPWWQYFPISLFADLLVPWEIVDERKFSFELEPPDPTASGWEAAQAAYRRLRGDLERASMPARR